MKTLAMTLARLLPKMQKNEFVFSTKKAQKVFQYKETLDENPKFPSVLSRNEKKY